MDYRTRLNRQLAEQARKRRAMFYRQHLKGVTCSDLARQNGITRQRMSVMLLQAEKEHK